MDINEKSSGRDGAKATVDEIDIDDLVSDCGGQIGTTLARALAQFFSLGGTSRDFVEIAILVSDGRGTIGMPRPSLDLPLSLPIGGEDSGKRG